MPIKAETAQAKLSGCVLAAAMLSLAIFTLPGRAEAAAAACAAATHPAKVTVTPMLPAPIEDETTSYHDLTKEMSFKKLKPEEDAMGVSSSSLGYDLHAEFRIAAHGGHSCAYLTSLAVRFGYTRRLVQIAAEVPKDSCMYREIREHEYKHVAVDNGIVRDNFAPIEAQIRTFAASFAPVDNPFEHAHVFTKTWPKEFSVCVIAKPIHVKNQGRIGELLSDVEPVLKIIADVVSAEGQHRHRIASHSPYGTGSGCRGFRRHRRA